MTRERPEPVIIVGGIMRWPGRYRELAAAIKELSGSEVYVAGLTPLDWLLGLVRGYGQSVFEVATAVDRALLENEAKKAIIVAHSAGGAVSRAYIGGDAPYGGRRYSGHRRVSHIITLGSPYFVKDSWPFSLLNQANDLFPGSLHKDSVRYISVAGDAVDGSKDPRVRKRQERMSEDGAVPGDGLVTVEAALLPGSEHVVLEGVFHDRPERPWYGDREVVERWWPKELRRDGRISP